MEYVSYSMTGMSGPKSDWDIDHEIRNMIYHKLGLYKRLQRFEHGGLVWGLVASITQFFINQGRKLRLVIELLAYFTAIILIQSNRPILGALSGAVGIVIGDMMTEFEIRISAMRIANSELEDYEREKHERRRRRIVE